MSTMGVILSTAEGVECHGDIMSTVGVILSTMEGVQYRGGYHEYHGGYLEYHGECSVPWGYHPSNFEYCGGIS